MILPSIDLMNGQAVQLKQGRELLLTDPREPVEIAREFGKFGPVAVVDLDAALGKGSNAGVMEQCCQVTECRVGGGIRTADDVRNWIKRGAAKVVIGTMATPEFLGKFPRSWLVAAIDAKGDEVVDSGWTRGTKRDLLAKAAELASFVSEFLFTQVEREGLLAGADFERAKRLQAAVKLPITVAGGIRSAAEVAELQRLGFNTQLGRAVYEGSLDLVEAFVASVAFNEAGLVPTIAQDAHRGDVLMLAWSNADSLRIALREGVGCFWSRSRGELWRKGETSGHVQKLVAARFDCDRDTLLFRVEQTGPACHTGVDTCFGDRRGGVFEELYGTLHSRLISADSAAKPSYTQQLLRDPARLAEKLREETEEIIVAPNRDNLRWECADLIYHLFVKMVAAGLTPAEVEAELRGRM
jgi:phosphoribosyl-ATP pyrophosphohydrolase/phosphoribosyl-AMP cyclohydrolase